MFIKQTDTTRMKPEMVVEKTKLNGYQILDRLRSHWLSTLAHDLSNPLFVARGYTRLALEEKDSQLTPSQRKYLTAALENIERLVTFAQELNDFPATDGFELDTVSFRTLLQQAADEILACGQRERARASNSSAQHTRE